MIGLFYFLILINIFISKTNQFSMKWSGKKWTPTEELARRLLGLSTILHEYATVLDSSKQQWRQTYNYQ